MPIFKDPSQTLLGWTRQMAEYSGIFYTLSILLYPQWTFIEGGALSSHNVVVYSLAASYPKADMLTEPIQLIKIKEKKIPLRIIHIPSPNISSFSFSVFLLLYGPNCVTRSPLLYFIGSWVALSFKVAHLSRPLSNGWVALSFLVCCPSVHPAMVTSPLLLAPGPQTHTFSESLW